MKELYLAAPPPFVSAAKTGPLASYHRKQEQNHKEMKELYLGEAGKCAPARTPAWPPRVASESGMASTMAVAPAEQQHGIYHGMVASESGIRVD